MLPIHQQEEADKENNLHQLTDQLTELAAEAGEPIQANLAGRAEMAADLEQVHLEQQELRHRQILELAAGAGALTMALAETADLDILLYQKIILMLKALLVFGN